MKFGLSVLLATAALSATSMASAAPNLSYTAGSPVASVGGKVASGSASGMN